MVRVLGLGLGDGVGKFIKGMVVVGINMGDSEVGVESSPMDKRGYYCVEWLLVVGKQGLRGNAHRMEDGR